MSSTTTADQRHLMWARVVAATVFALLALVVLIVSFAPEEDTAPVVSEAPAGQSRRFDPQIIDAAKKSLAAEPKVKAVLYDPEPLAVTWQIGVLGDGKLRYG